MKKIAILGAELFEDQRELLLFQPAGMEASYYSCKDPLDILDSLRDKDGIIVNLERVSKELLDELPKLQVVGRYGVGYDNINVLAATERKVAVINVPDYCIEEVAEHAVSLIFAVNRKLFSSARLTQQGIWGKVKDLKPIMPIKDITLGIVGTGRIGLKVIQIMAQFGTNILVYDPYIKPESVPAGVRMVGLDELLELSNIITIHCPLTEQTKHLFNEESFAKMKQKPALVNVSRGPIISETDLLKALDAGVVSFAALDVMEQEPPSRENPLLVHPKAVVTNHIAWYSVQAEVKLRDMLASKVIDYLNGKPVPTIVNRFEK